MNVVNVGQKLVVNDLGGNASNDGGHDENEERGKAPFHGLKRWREGGREGGQGREGERELERIKSAWALL
jgi:hypothetical protein